MDQPNVTVLTGALVTRVLFEGKQAIGVECVVDGQLRRFLAASEVVLSLGAIHTPKVLMQSGIGDAHDLQKIGIPVKEGLTGVGRNFQDHCMVAGCIWECSDLIEPGTIPHNPTPQANAFLRSSTALNSPDIQVIQAGFALASDEIARKYAPPPNAWTLLPTLVRPKSTGRIRLTGKHATDPVAIDANVLSDPADLAALVKAVELVNELGSSISLRRYSRCQIAPGMLRRSDLENFVRDSVVSVWHQTCTAKMGADLESVVNSKLQVHSIERLTVADGSVLRRVTTGNTMAPCVIIGERAALSLKRRHGIERSMIRDQAEDSVCQPTYHISSIRCASMAWFAHFACASLSLPFAVDHDAGFAAIADGLSKSSLRSATACIERYDTHKGCYSHAIFGTLSFTRVRPRRRKMQIRSGAGR
jgi:choline dehydrogenase